MKLFVSSKNLYEFIGKHPVVAVKFFNDNCAPCKLLSPILETMEEKMGDGVYWAEMNISVDGSEAAALKYGVRKTPTVCVFEDSNIVGRLIGANVQRPLQTLLDDIRHSSSTEVDDILKEEQQ